MLHVNQRAGTFHLSCQLVVLGLEDQKPMGLSVARFYCAFPD